MSSAQPAAGRGNDSDGADLQLTIFTTEAQQRQAIEADDFTEIDEMTAVLRELERIGLTGGVALDIDNQGNLTVTPKEFQPIVWTEKTFLSEQEIDEVIDVQPEIMDADPEVRNFSYTLVDDKLYFREDDVMQPVSLSQTAESRVRGLVELRDCVRRLSAYQTEDYPESMISAEQKRLNLLYDAFTEKHGRINSCGNNMAFAADESYYLLCSLEILDEKIRKLCAKEVIEEDFAGSDYPGSRIKMAADWMLCRRDTY